MGNLVIRRSAKRYGIRLWELAHYLGFSEPTFYRKLRFPLEPNEESVWIEAIEELAKIEPDERPLHRWGGE